MLIGLCWMIAGVSVGMMILGMNEMRRASKLADLDI